LCFKSKNLSLFYEIALISGEIEIFVKSEKGLGSTTRIKTLKHGEMFGELAFYTG